MGIYVIRRLIWLPFLVIIVTFITFAMLRLGPGDPVQIWLGQHQNDQVRERIRAKLGLDDPLFIQYARYMEGVITRLDFGESFKFRGKSVREVIGTRILVSMQLNLAAIIITLGVGIPVGLLAALRQGTGWDNLIVSIALAFQSLPVFITAPVMLLVFALHLDVLPTSGWGGFFSPKIVMPAIVMGVPGIAGRTFLATARAGANILMISQSSSEQSFCFTVIDPVAGDVKAAVEQELQREIQHNNIDSVDILSDIVIITVVGSGMRGTPGVAGRVFSLLGEHRINVLAIAQGSSECSISFIINESDLERAVTQLHSLALETADNDRINGKGSPC